MPRVDYHVHTNYSDGRLIPEMVRAAERAGLEALGFADHCHVTAEGEARRLGDALGFVMDEMYERRRNGIDWARERTDLRLFDAVEMDWDPDGVEEIEAFLEEAAFDYALGSVHWVDGARIQSDVRFADADDAERRAVVDGYYDLLVDLVESELFEVAAHVDLVERTPSLRGFATDEHHERVARALADSRTVPEVNAGRALRDYGEFHPATPFLETLREHGVEFVVGSDSHRPDEVADRAAAIDEHLAARDLEPVELDL